MIDIKSNDIITSILETVLDWTVLSKKKKLVPLVRTSVTLVSAWFQSWYIWHVSQDWHSGLTQVFGRVFMSNPAHKLWWMSRYFKPLHSTNGYIHWGKYNSCPPCKPVVIKKFSNFNYFEIWYSLKNRKNLFKSCMWVKTMFWMFLLGKHSCCSPCWSPD